MDRAAKAESPKIDLSGVQMKVREVFLAKNGTVVGKYGLNWQTGKWIQIADGADWPHECFAKIINQCCEKWREGVTLGKVAAVWDWKTEAKFCPECGRKLAEA